MKAWSEFFGKSHKKMGYTVCVTDLDVWMKPVVNNADFSYWSYMLVYLDDCLAIHHNLGPVMEDLNCCYKLKNDIYGEPERYLGANVGKYHLEHNK